jgi:acyl-CoA reductase-like NAD-dependent aldehyde dehydrogenase
MTSEVGKPYPESVGEVANVGSIFQYYAELARDNAGSIAGPIQPGTFQYKRYDPYGVSVHIVPYNYPILILAFTVAASLAAGNAVIIKPSEVSTLCTLAFMEHFKCLPPGIVSCITGDGGVGAHLVRSDNTDVIAFTGSVETARKVNIACAEKMKPCVIEAGGNDPIIVSQDCDPDFAAAAVTCSSFHLSGQICTSTERIYVAEEIYDQFLERLVGRVTALRIGDGFGMSEIGPLATEAARDKVIRLVDGAIAAGALIACGGKIPDSHKTGWFYEPTVLTEVTTEMDILNGEIFGPVAPVCRITDVDDGILKSNDSRYGLGASILTNSMAEAMLAVKKLESGMVWVNNPLVDNDALPFGGQKLSGVGRELGHEGLNAFRQAKFVTIDPTQKIHDWWYPYPDDVFYKSVD